MLRAHGSLKSPLPVRYFSALEEKQLTLGNFCNAKDKECGAGNVRHVIKASKGDKYATPDSTRGRIDASPLRADNRRRFMLRWAAAASDVDFVTKKQS